MTVPVSDRRIVAMGGGGFLMRPDNGLLDGFVLDLGRERSGRDRPRICFVPTAGGDSDASVVEFYAAFADQAEPRHLALFARTIRDIESFLVWQDVVYVGGGNTANMLAIWRLQGVDRAMRAAWEAGVVMAGMSAGAICWFEACTTDSFGQQLQPLRDGLGVLGGSYVPHYHGEAQRQPLFHRLVAEETLPAGFGVDDGAALVYHGTELHEVVSASAAAAAYRVEKIDNEVRETPLPVRFLGA